MTTTSGSIMAPAGTVTWTFRKDVQGIRALAVTMVVLYHAGGILPGGFVGVDVFFVISGFVITGLLSREFADNGDIRLRTFYARRARRLLPAMAVMSIVVLLGSALISSPLTAQGNVGSAAVAAATFSSNFYFMLTTGGYFQAVAEANPLLHTWSLAVEEQFYLVFPIAFLFFLRLSRRTKRKIVLPGLASLASMSFIFCLVTTFGWVPNIGRLSQIVENRHELVAFYTPMSRAWEFMAGALIYMLGPRLNLSRAGQRVVGVIGLSAMVGAMFWLEPGKSFPGIEALLPVLGAAALLVVGFGSGQHRLTTRLLSGRAMIWLGDRSYSWYLWHWPFIVFAALWFPGNRPIVVSAMAASLVVAAITYRFFERPIHRLHFFTEVRSKVVLIVVCITLPITLGSGLAQASARSWGRADIAKIQGDIALLHEDQLHGCARTQSLDVMEVPSCFWGESGRPLVLLIGDSNAGHLTEPLVQAAERLGYRLEVITMGGCPMMVRRVYSSEACRNFVTGNLKFLRDNPLRYRDIIISNDSTKYVADEMQAASNGSTIQSQALLTSDSDSWAKDMLVTMRLVPAASGLVVVGAVPQYTDLPDCLVPSILSSASHGCGEWGRGNKYLNIRTTQILAESRVVHVGGGVYMDTARRLCTPKGGCSAFGPDGQLLYKDGEHLSVSGSMIFAGDLEAALRSAVR